MFTFHDSVPPAIPGNQAVSQGGSPTPIFDRLFEEWQRMFRAVPGDRYGEGYNQSGAYAYPNVPQTPVNTPAYDPYTPHPRHGRSGLALMPVAGYQTQHMSL